MSTNTETPSKQAKTIKSIFISDSRHANDDEDLWISTYIYKFDKSMASLRVWEALMVLEEKGKFHFPNVGDRGYHSLIDNVKDRQIPDEHFQEFFNLAMEEKHEWTREENMKQLGNCSWMVTLIEE